MYSLIVLLLAVGQTEERREGPLVPRPDVVLIWNDVALDTIRTERVSPPMAARNLAILHAAMFEAVNAVQRTHWHYLIDVHPPECTAPEVAASVAAHRILVTLYPAQTRRFNAILRQTLQGFADPAREQGITLGSFIAEQMLDWRADDGSERMVRYEVGSSPREWRPTPPKYAPALLPQWPRVLTFALPDTSRVRPPDPPSHGTNTYIAHYLEVKALGGNDSKARTPEQTEIARFWADGAGTVTPPGHWNRIARSVALSRGTSLGENARLFALLNIALADTSIACWDCKYRFKVWRPIQAIREARTDGDPGWTPLLETPPFPSYTSGHSSFSGAAAAVLAGFFGTDAVRFSTTSEELSGVTRSFSSFSAAAHEAGRSRIYGGIHYEFDNSAGLSSGRAIGQYVSRHFLTPRRAVRCEPIPLLSSRLGAAGR